MKAKREPTEKPRQESFWVGKDRAAFTAKAEEYFKEPGKKLGFLFNNREFEANS